MKLLWLVKFVVELLVRASIGLFMSCFVREKCCEDLGCFKIEYPWTSIIRPVSIPVCAEECPMTFNMFFRPNITEIHNITWPVTSLNHTPYDGKKPTVMYVPGFRSHVNDPWNFKIVQAYLGRRDVNFIFLDWNQCTHLHGLTILGSMRVFAAQAAWLLKYTVKHHGAHPSRFHIIGHSWGAHLAGYIARYVNGTKKLTGLEPGIIAFWDSTRQIQMNIGDAEFVEVGHTETLPFIGLGILKPKGHVDFYFNGNFLQPSCIAEHSTKIREDRFDFIHFLGIIFTCGHMRALDFYINALRETNCTFWGERMNFTVNTFNSLTGGVFAENTTSLEHCDIDSCIPWGIDSIEYPARGSFSVATADNPPYCISNPNVDKRMAQLLEEYKQEHYEDNVVNNTAENRTVPSEADDCQRRLSLSKENFNSTISCGTGSWRDIRLVLVSTVIHVFITFNCYIKWVN